jgi:hypothetical protein
VTLTAPGAGQFAAAAKAKGMIAKGSTTATKAGVVILELKPTKKGLKAIRRKGKLKATLGIAFTSPEVSASDGVPITLKAKKTRRR